MTCLRNRLNDVLKLKDKVYFLKLGPIHFGKNKKIYENLLASIEIIENALNLSCCFMTYEDGKIGCYITGPCEKEEFFKRCKKCKEKMIEELYRIKKELGIT